MNFLNITLVVICAFIGQAVGLRCYTCTFSSVDSDQSCLTITENSATVECPYTYCTTFRQELLDPPGVVFSFNRGCSESPAFLNHDVTDSTFRTFYRACTSDLCNIGNGVQSVTGGGLSQRPVYDGGNLLVPGTGNSAGKLQISLYSPIFLTLFVKYLIETEYVNLNKIFL